MSNSESHDIRAMICLVLWSVVEEPWLSTSFLILAGVWAVTIILILITGFCGGTKEVGNE